LVLWTALTTILHSDNYGVARLLIKHGYNVNHRISNKPILWHMVDKYRGFIIVNFLLHHGANVNIKCDNKTIMEYLFTKYIKKGYKLFLATEIIQLLIEFGCDLKVFGQPFLKYISKYLLKKDKIVISESIKFRYSLLGQCVLNIRKYKQFNRRVLIRMIVRSLFKQFKLNIIDVRNIVKLNDILIFTYINFVDSRDIFKICDHEFCYYNYILVFMIIILAPLILFLWRYLMIKETKAIVENKLYGIMSMLNTKGFIVFIFSQALFNSIAEEVLLRGIIQFELYRHFDIISAIIIQGIVFGFLHYKGGFPNGLLGSILASIFGIVMGIHYYFNGLWLSILVHFIADLSINIIIKMLRT